MLGLLQSVPDQPNTMVVLESTANGVGDWFHDMWQKAEKGENDYTPIFLPWFIQPEYTRSFFTDNERKAFVDGIDLITRDNSGNDVHTYEYEIMQKHNLTYEQLNWRKHILKNKCEGDEMLFMQEYPCTPEEAFISSGRPKFSIPVLRKYQTRTSKPIRTGYLYEKEDGTLEFVDDPKGYIAIWKEPDPEIAYAVGADVAEGLATGDFSCGYVGDSEFDIVARWYGHIDADLFGDELVKLGRYYNGAYLGVENNNHGLTTLKAIERKEYWNVYYSKTFEKTGDSPTQKLGWSTNVRTKPLMIDKLAEFIREQYLGIPDDLLISEAFTYVIEDNGKTNGQTGCHDDTVMATAVLLQLLLEGKHDNYIPEIPIDERGKERAREVVDPLFEEEKENTEVSI
jgi:hypothetical protein